MLVGVPVEASDTSFWKARSRNLLPSSYSPCTCAVAALVACHIRLEKGRKPTLGKKIGNGMQYLNGRVIMSFSLLLITISVIVGMSCWRKPEDKVCLLPSGMGQLWLCGWRSVVLPKQIIAPPLSVQTCKEFKVLEPGMFCSSCSRLFLVCFSCGLGCQPGMWLLAEQMWKAVLSCQLCLIRRSSGKLGLATPCTGWSWGWPFKKSCH